MAELVGDYSGGLASDEALAALRNRHSLYGNPEDKVAVYQDQALDSAAAGSLVFIIIGPERTLKEAPVKAPDGPYGMGWRFLHVGFLNLETNQLEKTDG